MVILNNKVKFKQILFPLVILQESKTQSIIEQKMIYLPTNVTIPTINTAQMQYVKQQNITAISPRPNSRSGIGYDTRQLESYKLFLEQINYGVSLVLLTSRKTRQEVKCYLSEYSNSVLILLRKNNEVLMIDIGGSDILGFDAKYEVSWNLEDLEYLIIKQNGQDFVLLFETEEQKLWFQNNLLIMKSNTPTFNLDDNRQFGKAMSLFKKYQKIYDNVEGISMNDLSIINQILHYRDAEKIKYIVLLLSQNSRSQIFTLKDFSNYLRLYYCKLGCYPIFIKYCKLAPKFIPHAPNLDLLTPVMTRMQFKSFLMNQQRETEEQAQIVLSTLGSNALCYYQFCRFIFSKYNYIYKTKVVSRAEMDFPLNYYYCMSSHNTYLIGNQLTSKSKVRRYIEDFEKGYRSVELDVHDSLQGPIINHRLTFTSSIHLEDIVKAIAKFSNSTVHTPIILSLQIHCKPMGRFETSQIIMKHLGDKVLIAQKDWQEYPKLSNLWNKIILKGHLSIDQLAFYPNSIVKTQSLRSLTGIYKASNKEDLNSCLEYVSMGAGNFQSKCKSKRSEILCASSKGWVRVYPNGTNFFSSNFNPICGFQNGAQMIAINSQKNDIWKLILQSYFEQKQKYCAGYTIKPSNLIEGNSVFPTPIKVVIQVISASNIRFNDSFTSYHVKAAFFGSQQDNVFGNNFELFIDVTDSVSGEEGVFTNPVPIVYSIQQPCFGFVVFELSRYGQASVPVKSLRNGYHTIQLLNPQLQPIPHSSLLIRTDVII